MNLSLPWMLLSTSVIFLAATLWLHRRRGIELTKARLAEQSWIGEKGLLEFKIDSVEREKSEQMKRWESCNAQLLEAQGKVSALGEQIRHANEKLAEQQVEVSRVRQQLQLEFETLNRRFFDESSEKLTKLSRESFVTLLQPFDQELKSLQTRIHEVYDKESRERLSLEKHIEHMMKTNQQMSLEAQSLTKALRGDVKAQGNWGEVVLERILESSGLREGEEFVVQGRGLGLRSDDGSTRKPDVLIHLPGGRHLIIDSKVSLTAYEEQIRAESETQKQAALQQFISSIRRHVEELAAKNYQTLYGINSPDFVMLFMPTDGAFSLAHQADPQLFTLAMERRIAIVSPSLLFPNLRTVETMWRQERQSKNAEEIARQAGGLYDKFALLLEDLEQVQVQLKRTEDSMADAFLKLKTGKGNLLDRVEKLKQLGAKAKKQLPGIQIEDTSEL